jgi:hypothetical protein
VIFASTVRRLLIEPGVGGRVAVPRRRETVRGASSRTALGITTWNFGDIVTELTDTSSMDVVIIDLSIVCQRPGNGGFGHEALDGHSA